MNLETLIQKKQKTNQDYKIICTELLKQNLVSKFHNILDDQGFYTDNELPLTLYYQRTLIKQLKDQSLKILQIIAFVKFQVGNYTEFLSNLIEYKFKKISELNNSQLHQIQYIIGQIVVDFWWQYEYYKKVVQESYPEFYPELITAIREKYKDSSTYLSLMWVCSKNEELRLIVNNSLFAIYDLNRLDAKVDEYIQSITQLNPFNFETILSYIQAKSILKQKFILIYFRILFFYISLLHFKNEINPNETELFNNKIYQKWQQSRIEIFEDLLLKNSSNFSENFQLNDLQDQFQAHCSTFESKLFQLQQLEIFEKTQNNESIEVLLKNKQFDEFKKLIEEIPFFILSNQFQSQSGDLMYNFIIAQFANIQQTLTQLEPLLAVQNFEDILNQLLSYFNNTTTIYQKQAIIDYLFSKNKLSKIEHQSVKKALVIKFDNVIQLCQFCLSLRKVISSQDLIKILQTYKIIDLESMNFAAQVLKSKEIKNLLLIALHIYLEGNQKEQYYQQLVDFIRILFNLFDTNREQVLNFFSVCFLDLKYYQINHLILQNQETMNDENCFLETIEFIKIILDQKMTVETKKYMLHRLSLLLSYVEDFQLEFLCEQIEQNSNILLRYLKLKYFTKIGKLDQAMIFSKYLKRNALKFYRNHCADLLETAEIEILTEADILQSKQLAQEYFPFIKNAKYKINQNSFQIIQNLFGQEKQTSYQIIQYFDNIYFNNKYDNQQIESLNQYTSNQLQFLQNNFQQKKQQINEKINIEKQQIQQQVEIAKQFSSELQSYIQNINNKDQSSSYYLIQYDLTLEESEMILFYIFDNLLIKNSKQYLNLLSPEFRQEFFNQDTIFDEKDNEAQIKSILQNCQQTFQIKCLNAFLNQLLIQNQTYIQEIIEKQNQINQINVEQKFQQFEIQMIGCKQLCPFCNRKCDVDPTQNHVHKCENGHQLRGMAGIIVDDKPSLFFCEELEDNFNVFDTQTKTAQKWSELKKKYKDWNFNVLNNQQLKLRKDLLLMLWDSYFGSQLCKLRNQQFSLKRDLDLEEYRGKKFTRVIQTSKKFHYVFALDDSGSMGGQRFENSKKGAYECLRILSQNSEARATIIIFSSYARTVAVQEAIQPQALLNKINFQGGGTSFESALETIYQNVYQCINQFTKHIILFYTDGEADFPKNSISKFKSLNVEERQKIDLHICCEGNAPDNLAKMYSAFDGQIGSTNLMQQISPENVGQAWQKQIEEVIYKSC